MKLLTFATERGLDVPPKKHVDDTTGLFQATWYPVMSSAMSTIENRFLRSTLQSKMTKNAYIVNVGQRKRDGGRICPNILSKFT